MLAEWSLVSQYASRIKQLLVTLVNLKFAISCLHSMANFRFGAREHFQNGRNTVNRLENPLVKEPGCFPSR